MLKYVFEYEIISTGQVEQFSITATSEEDAKARIKARVADIEFTDESDINIKALVKTTDDKDNYFECESCT